MDGCVAVVGMGVASSSPLRGVATFWGYWKLQRRSPHRPYEGSQLYCDTALLPYCFPVLIAPTRGRNAAARAGAARAAPVLIAPTRGRNARSVTRWRMRRVLIAPTRGRNCMASIGRDLIGRSSSPLRGVATSGTQWTDSGKPRSSSPLRGVATAAGYSSKSLAAASSSPLRGVATSTWPACRGRMARSLSPLRGVATVRPVPAWRPAPRPHRPYEGSQRLFLVFMAMSISSPHRPLRGVATLKQTRANSLGLLVSSSPLRGVATPQAAPPGDGRTPPSSSPL